MLTRRNIDIKQSKIVRVLVTFNDGSLHYGTGFFVGPEGLILTCGHVVLGRDFSYVKNDQNFINAVGANDNEKAMNFHLSQVRDVKVEVDGTLLKDVVLEKINPYYDVALLRVSEVGYTHPYFKQDLVNEPYLGEEISFYGYPDVLGHTCHDSPFVVNTSIVSTFPTTTVGGGLYRHMQINATTIGGISGAPVFLGDKNTVVGIINGSFHWAFNNIVSRNQNGDSIWSTRVPLGIGYSTPMKVISENTDFFN